MINLLFKCRWLTLLTTIGLCASFEVLLKTRETFKLADLQFLAARTFDSKCERLVLDARTGASLLRLERKHDLFCKSNFVSEIDWIGNILARGSSAEALIRSIAQESGKWDLVRPWILRYAYMEGAQVQRNDGIAEKNLLCAVSQRIKSPSAALVDGDQCDRLIILRVNPSNALGSEMFYLVQVQSIAAHEKQQEIQLRWSMRPFPYSSAINYAIAEMALGILLHRLQQKSVTPKLLDPTCGSGSFLAVAMALGIDNLQGRDINPVCVKGTIENLQHMFGTSASLTEQCQVVVHDSLEPSDSGTKFNCMCCNLPWGENTKSFYGEDLRILSAVRHELEVEAPCVVVWKISANQNLQVLEESLVNIGYHAIGHAFVPPIGFHLPTSKKMKDALDQRQTGRSHCLVSLLETCERANPARDSSSKSPPI